MDIYIWYISTLGVHFSHAAFFGLFIVAWEPYDIWPSQYYLECPMDIKLQILQAFNMFLIAKDRQSRGFPNHTKGYLHVLEAELSGDYRENARIPRSDI